MGSPSKRRKCDETTEINTVRLQLESAQRECAVQKRHCDALQSTYGQLVARLKLEHQRANALNGQCEVLQKKLKQYTGEHVDMMTMRELRALQKELSATLKKVKQ